MRLSLADLYAALAGDGANFPDLPLAAEGIHIRRGPGELLILDVCRDKDAAPFSYRCLLQAEQTLAAALGVEDLAIAVHGPAALQTAEDMEPWIAYHAGRPGSFEAQIFRRGHLRETEGEELAWFLPAGIYEILRKRGKQWLEKFWQAVCPDLPPISVRPQGKKEEPETPAPFSEIIAPEKDAALAFSAPLSASLPASPTAPKASAKRGSAASHNHSKKAIPGLIWGRPRQDLPLTPLASLSRETDMLRARGSLEDFDARQMKSGRYLLSFLLVDGQAALRCQLWTEEKEVESLSTAILAAPYLEVTAAVEWNERWEQDYQARLFSIAEATAPGGREDQAVEKRVELHLHSKFSAKDAIATPGDLVRLAAQFGHPAVAITDHGGVQGFPEAAEAMRALAEKGQKIKLIYGMEGYLVDDGTPLFIAPSEKAAGACHSLAMACCCWQGEELSDFFGLRWTLDEKGRRSEPQRLELHGLAEHKDEAKPSAKDSQKEGTETEIPQALYQIRDFLEDTALVMPDALPEINRLRHLGIPSDAAAVRCHLNPCLLDLPHLAVLQPSGPEQTESRTGSPASKNAAEAPAAPGDEADASPAGERVMPDSLPQDAAAAAWAEGNGYHLTALQTLLQTDSAALEARFTRWAGAFDTALQRLAATSWKELNKLAGAVDDAMLRARKVKPYHIILLVENLLGLYHLYRLVSLSNIEHFYSRPRIPRSLLRYYREGLLLGSACVYGEVFWHLLGEWRAAGGQPAAVRQTLQSPSWRERASFYDYLEIQPLGNNAFLMLKAENQVHSQADLQTLNKLILELGDHCGVPVCATCDVHFLNKEDALYREIVMHGMGFSGEEQPAPLYFRSTEEMLEEFAYLGERREEVVIANPRHIAARIQPDILPFPDGSFPPIVTSAEEDIRRIAWESAQAMYGRDGVLPESIAQRLEIELDSVISNGYAIMYYIAHKLVKKSNDDGYIVGSRGSVGSSLLATFCGISEVNPLPPHYICPHCHHYEEVTSGDCGSGYDLPPRDCPECGTPMRRDGQDIPFATFLGFHGDKQPDIDLNFSGEYQGRAHSYIEEMFGSSHTFRAGTIQGYADKQSAALVYHYYEDKGENRGRNQIQHLARAIQGIKVSTGQHPGGIVVVPHNREVFDFTPIQYPAEDKSKGIITTHFDFNSMHDTILKIDALGHDDPTMLKMLSDMTGVDILDIPIPDERVMQLFETTAAIGIEPEKSTIGSATIGLPEVGTMLARAMIQETHPVSFYDLVQLSGLSHGTNVWAGNAQDLIRAGTANIHEVIGCRDSIMTTLIYNGVAPEHAFKIMESVRKGRGLKPEQEAEMREHQVPEWYIESCRKIKYLFPKAHAAAYSISTQRVAWFKVYHPEAFYAAWFTVRGDDFSADSDLLPAPQIAAKRAELRQHFSQIEKKDEKKFYILELVEEMQTRGIDFLPLDLEASEAHKFSSPKKGWIRPPFDVIPGISRAMGEQIVAARQAGGPFRNVEELRRRAGLGDAAIEALRSHGLLEKIPESAQVSLFDFSS